MLPTLDGSSVTPLIALIAGFVTFFASCLLPLVPTYLAYLAGISLQDAGEKVNRRRLLLAATLFVIGFTITFMLLGLALNQLAATIVPVRNVIEKASGVLFVILGLVMIGVLRHPIFAREFKFDAQGVFSTHLYVHALLTGVAFGFGWTPCIGPILALILYWASQADSVLQGIGLLSIYSLGLGIPFLVVAAGFGQLVPLLKKYRHLSKISLIISGSFLLFTGVLLILGEFQDLSMQLLRLFNLGTHSL